MTPAVVGRRLSRDTVLLIAGQAVRASGYGFIAPHRFKIGTSGIFGAIVVLGIYVAVKGRSRGAVTR